MKNSIKPLYQKIYEEILDDINSEKYISFEKLPSENFFAGKYGVNRHTVRKALQLLKNKGVIYSKKGKGNFITNIEIPYSITDKSSFSSVIYDLGYEPKTEIISADIVYPSSQTAQNLDINENLKVIELKLLRYANNIPITFSISYFDAYKFKEILNYLDTRPFSLYSIIKKSYPGMEIKKLSTVFKAITPTDEISELLRVSINTPILGYSTVSVNQHGEYLEYGTSYSRGDSCKVKVNLA